MRAVTRTMAVVVLVAALVVSPSLSASAADPPDFTPSGSKWRSWMLNVVGSVLGGAMPNAWKAEQIGNEFRYNWSWDQFAASHGYSANSRNVNGDLAPIPKPGSGTYDDYVIEQYEKQVSKGGSGNKPMAAPASKPKAFAKTVGGALSAFMAFEVGSFLGSSGTNLVGGWFGFDPQGAVCGQTADGSFLSAATRYLASQDCSMWDLAPEYVPNGDAGLSYATATIPGFSITYVGRKVLPPGASFDQFCYTTTGTISTAYRMRIKQHNGSYSTNSPGSNFVLGQGGLYNCPTSQRETTAWRPEGGPTGSGADTPAVQFLSVATGAVVSEMTATQQDPDRQMECEVTYTDGSFLSALGPVYKESTGGVSPPVCPGTPDGKVPETVELNDTQLGGGPTTEVAEMPVTEEFQDWMQDYPECTTGACKLDLKKKGTAPVSCFDLETGCVGWFEDPNKADLYQCTYGAHDVPLEECNVYSGLFAPQRIEIGSPYSDPTTGAWSGGQTAPKSGTTAMAQSVQDPELLRTCNFDGLGFDPVGWVLRPIQCGMEWAFAPRPSVTELQFAQAGQAWEGKPPQVIAAAVTGWSIAPAATGCSIPAELFGTSFNVLDACNGIMAAVAVISRLITAGAMLVLVIVVLRRQIAAMVGYNQGQG